MNADCSRTPGCPGHVDETGFCTVCGRAAAAEPPAPAPDAPWSVRPETWEVAGLVDLPVLSFDATRDLPAECPEPPEESRFCAHCGRPVGRGRAGVPPLTKGFCTHCQTPFSFEPGPRRGDVIDDRYEVVGCLARGGLGRVYLARDTHLDNHEVVLKGLINANDRVALAQAVAERRFLTETNHPTIVRIRGFAVERDPSSAGQTGYIVMEYLNGVSLHKVMRVAAGRGGPDTALPVSHVLAYGHEILDALDHLHKKGLIYCDLKPDNVMRVADGVKLIDLGAVRRAGDRKSPVIGALRYLVSKEERDSHGLTVRSDLYALGVTLDDLFRSSTRERADAGTRVGIVSFQHLVNRARHDRWSRRFASAAEMKAQLIGVLREIVAAHWNIQHPDTSTVFAPTAVLLDAGLGAVPALQTWTAAKDAELLNDGCPAPPAAAVGLPVPSPVPEGRDDPVVDFLDTVSALDARSLLARLAAFEATSAGSKSVEIQLCRCRAHLELAELDSAEGDLRAASKLLGVSASEDWRMAWHDGLLALALARDDDDVAAAQARFDDVYAELPGETAPKLALAYCAERRGHRDRAGRYYEAVWRRDRLQVSAAFGLVRIKLAQGSRAGAVELLDEVPRTSQHFDAARTAAVRILAGRLPGAPSDRAESAGAQRAGGAERAGVLPEADDLGDAVRRLLELHLDGGDAHGESRARLTAVVRKAALDAVRAGADLTKQHGGEVLGSPVSERGLRRLLEASFRSLAEQARTPDEHSTLIDRANAVRPRTLLRLR